MLLLLAAYCLSFLSYPLPHLALFGLDGGFGNHLLELLNAVSLVLHLSAVLLAGNYQKALLTDPISIVFD